MVKNVLNTLRKKQKNNKGFSLVELIVVIAIMAVLVGILAPQFIKYVERSRQSSDMQSVSQLKDDVEAAVADDEGNTEVKIEIKGGDNGEATVTGVTGISSPTAKLKSTGWTTVKFKLDRTTGQWSFDGDAKNAKNTKEPTKDMAEVFSLKSTTTTTPAGEEH